MAPTPRDGSDFTHGPDGERSATRRADWAPLLVAMVVPLVLLQVAVVRPTITQLDRMRGQVARLEATVERLRQRTPDADRSASLLAALGEQSDHIAAAESALERLDRLQDRLAGSVASAVRSTAALDRLDRLAFDARRQSMQVRRAADALADLAGTPCELEAAVHAARSVAPAAEEVRSLAERLGESRRLVGVASDRVDGLLASQQALAIDSERLATVEATLDSLAGLAVRLNGPLLSVAVSHDRLDGLMRLKDAVLAQTEDLPAAFETLQLMVDMHEDYRRASVVVRTVQRLLADLVLLEPSISRVAGVIEPIVERTSLGQLSGGDLRLVLREMRERHAEAIRRLDEASVEVAANPAPEAK